MSESTSDLTPQQEEEIVDFFAKIDWEGGFYSAVSYGLRAEDYPGLPEEFSKEWEDLYAKAEKMNKLYDEFFSKWEEKCSMEFEG